MEQPTSIFDYAEQITQDYLYHLCNHPNHCGNDMPVDDWNLMCALLCEVLTHATDRAKTKKPWGVLKTFDRQTVYAAAFRDIDEIGLRMELRLHLGYVQMRIRIDHFDELGHMDNKFWNLLAETIDLFNLQYEEADHHFNIGNTRFKKLGKLQKSTLFALMTDFYSAEDEESYAPIVGNLTYTCEWNGDWYEVIDTLTDLISRCYRICYPLYRSHYIKLSNNLKKEGISMKSYTECLNRSRQ